MTRSNRCPLHACRTALAGWCSLALALNALAGQNTNPEIEPNQTKSTATLAADADSAGMHGGDLLTGTTTGSASTAGSTSADYFRVRTAAAPLGIYRHRLTLTTSGPQGHTGSLRGLAQTEGVIAAASDVPFQTSSPSTTPARFNAWYGFGRQEEVFYRVVGTLQTTQPYAATLSTDPITPIDLPTPLVAGSITIDNDPASGNTADTDLWLYDASLNPIAGAGNDGQNTLRRDLAAGTYYLAVSNFNLANNLASPADDAFRDGSVLDFPNVIANGNASTVANMNMRFSHAGGSVVGVGSKAAPFDVVWYRFTVVAGNNPVGAGAAVPDPVPQGADIFVTVVVTPAASPPSTAITVDLDATTLGVGPLSLRDDGTLGDITPADNIFSKRFTVPVSAPIGAASLPYVVSDGQGRSSSGSITVNIITPPPPPPLNDTCAGAVPVSSLTIPFNNANATTDPQFPANPGCSEPVQADVWYLWTPPAVIGNGQWQVSSANPNVRIGVWPAIPCPPLAGSQLVCSQNATPQRFASTPSTPYLIQLGGTAVTPFVGDASVTFTFIPFQGVCCIGGALTLRTQAECSIQAGGYVGDNTFGGASGPGANFSSPRTNQAIPDNSSSGLTDFLTVEGTGTVQNLFVHMHLAHPFVGDLIATLSTGSTTVTLFSQINRSDAAPFGSNAVFAAANELRFLDTASGDLSLAAAAPLAAIPAGDYRPAGPNNANSELRAFVGQPVAGIWTLRIFDTSSGDVGTLIDWSLEFNPPTSCPPPCTTDFNRDGATNPDDLADFIAGYFATPSDPRTDINGDGAVDPDDLADYITAFFQGC